MNGARGIIARFPWQRRFFASAAPLALATAGEIHRQQPSTAFWLSAVFSVAVRLSALPHSRKFVFHTPSQSQNDYNGDVASVMAALTVRKLSTTFA